jgi:hypothetical protein
MVGFFAPTPDFVASHGDAMWAVFVAAVCFTYAFTHARRRSVVRFLTSFVRLLFCLGLALSIDLVVYVWWYRPSDQEWRLGAYILSAIAVVWGLPAFVAGYFGRILRDRLTMRSSEPRPGQKLST